MNKVIQDMKHVKLCCDMIELGIDTTYWINELKFWECALLWDIRYGKRG